MRHLQQLELKEALEIAEDGVRAWKEFEAAGEESMTDTDTALGHNLPPADANPLRDRLVDEHYELIERCAALEAAFDRAPLMR